MRTPTLVIAAALGLVAAGAGIAPGFAQTPAAPAAGRTAPMLDIAQVHARLEAAGYRSIDEIERKRDRYEVKAFDAEGRRVELDVDPATAAVRKAEVKRERRADTPPQGLGIAEIHARLEAAGYRPIEKIERGRDRVEVRARDAEGRLVELDVDAASARVLGTEVKSEPRRQG